MNAESGNDKCVGNSYHNYTNRNGEYLLDQSIDCSLNNISTNFQKKLWTENGKIVLLTVARSTHTHHLNQITGYVQRKSDCL